jgi:hypothetical protein
MQLGKQRAELEKILKPTGTHPAVAPNEADIFGELKEAQGYRSNGAVVEAPKLSYKNPGSEAKAFTLSDADVVRSTFSLEQCLFMFYFFPNGMPDDHFFYHCMPYIRRNTCVGHSLWMLNLRTTSSTRR